MNVWMAVAAGGALGASGRYAVLLAMRRFGPEFPWATLAVNVIGSFLIGLLWAWFLSRPDFPEWLRLGLMTGVLGGFTTLSSVSLESVLLAESGAPWLGVASMAANVGLGFGACLVAIYLMRSLLAS